MRKAAWVISAVAGAVVCAALGALSPWGASSHIPVPPSTATPNAVVAALVRAWNAHDSATVAALYDPRLLHLMIGEPEGGLQPYARVRLIGMSAPVDVPSGDRYGTGAGERWVGIGTILDLQGTDGSQSAGANPVSFDLVRTGPGGAWRVIRQGLG